MQNSEAKCERKLTIVNIDLNPPEHDDLATLKHEATKSIMKFGKGKKADVEKFVNENFAEDEEAYVMGKPLSFYSLIHKGILHFR